MSKWHTSYRWSISGLFCFNNISNNQISSLIKYFEKVYPDYACCKMFNDAFFAECRKGRDDCSDEDSTGRVSVGENKSAQLASYTSIRWRHHHFRRKWQDFNLHTNRNGEQRNDTFFVFRNAVIVVMFMQHPWPMAIHKWGAYDSSNRLYTEFPYRGRVKGYFKRLRRGRPSLE